MITRNLGESTERFSRGGLEGAALKGAYYLAQLVLANTNVQNIGILLRAEDDRFFTLWRRDFERFAGCETDGLQHLISEISEKANGLGAQKCLQWLRAKPLREFRISPRRPIVIADSAEQTLARLYTKHICPHVLPYRTHLPQYSLEAAAGKFGRQMDVVAEGWVEVHTNIPLTDDMFVVHVEGHSMEPLIPAASLCAFRCHKAGSLDGKVLLIEQYGELGGSRFTVKLCHISEHADPTQPSAKSHLQQRVTLESINPGYESWDVPLNGRIRPIGEFLFVVGPAAVDDN